MSFSSGWCCGIWLMWLCLLNFGSSTIASGKVRPHIAFVFAGSPRSFPNHFVHESIRVNLIHAFCPPKVCNAVLFFRISLADNVHETSSGESAGDGDGIAVPADPNMAGPVMFGIRRLSKVPGSSSNESIPTVISWAEVGSRSEKQAIMEEFPSLRHRIFALLDSRRYSMYYNRHKSFMQVPAYEREHSVKFQWVVHVRMDAIWAEPVQPVAYWSSLGPTVNHRYDKFPPGGVAGVDGRRAPLPSESMKVWVVDTWFDDVPDTFALIPRVYADKFYDFDSLAADGVVCLGGGNVNITKAKSPSELAKLNFTRAESKVIRKLVCTEDELGGSEVIMKNKLNYHKISLDNGNLGYQTFFTAIVRPNMDDMCFYLEAARLIGWVWPRQYANQATFPGCVIYLSLIRQYRDRVAQTISSGASVGMLVGPSSEGGGVATSLLTRDLKPRGQSFESTCFLDSTGEYTGPNCLLDRAVTDWNFMPFRIRKHGQCTTFASEKAVELKPCIAKELFGNADFNMTYSPLQLIHVLPLLRTAQQLVVVGEGESRILCLTTESVEGESAKRVVVRRCFNDKGIHNWGNRDADPSADTLTQMFLVRLIPDDQLVRAEERDHLLVGRFPHPQSRLTTVVTMSVAQVTSYSDLPLLYDWYHAPFTHQREASGGAPSYPSSLQCMAVYPAATSEAATTDGHTGVVMETCDLYKSSQRLVIERTTTVAWVKHIRKHLDQWHYGALAKRQLGK